MSHGMHIGRREIGRGRPAYIIAEMSANHGRRFEQAVRIVKAAKAAGADAVKLQTYTPDTMTIPCSNRHFQIGKGTIWEGRNLYELYGEAFTPWDWQPKLKKIANGLGVDCFSTPFDDTAVDFLEKMHVPAYKIASFELVDIPLLKRVGATRKPVILSTGMASVQETQEALRTLRNAGAKSVALLKCTSAYPAPSGEMNLRTINDMIEKFRCPVGLSDHSMEVAIPVAAVALGACIIEKHLTLSRAAGGPDAEFSLEPQEFKAMVDGVRTAEVALGRVHYGPTRHEEAEVLFRRSLFVVEDVAAGETFTAENVRSIRPGHGLPPRFLSEILGRKAAVAVNRGTPLAWRHVMSES